MAENGSWPSIRQHGLLSTTALLDLFEIEGPERIRIESEWRRNSIPIENPEYGTAVIRDQGPMPPHTLEPLLVGLTPVDWYELINRKSFFWVTRDRLNRFLNAAPYRSQVHDVITVDTRLMIERHYDHIILAPFNTGVSSFGPRYKRDINTFKRIEEFLREGHFSNVVELAVEYHVQDIADLAISVEKWRGTEFQRTVWQR